MTAPCKDCSKRHPNCHSECEEYIAFDNYNQKRREERVKHLGDDDYSPSRRARERNYKIWEMRGKQR
jgi:hypothetical protein